MGLTIGGRTVSGPKKITICLPREEGPIPFQFTAVLDDEAFRLLCPKPKPPRKWKAGEGNVDDIKDTAFLSRFNEWVERKGDWYFLTSIAPSEIEWTTVDMSSPSTWGNWRSELIEAGFNENERDTIWGGFIQCNMITDDMLTQARNHFLAEQEAIKSAQQISLLTEPQLSTSGEPVNDSAYVPQG